MFKNKTMTSLLLCFTSVVLWLTFKTLGVMDADRLSSQLSAYAVPLFRLESSGFNHGWCSIVVFFLEKTSI